METESKSTIHCTSINFIPLTTPSRILTKTGKLHSGIRRAMMPMLLTISMGSWGTFLQYDSCVEYDVMTSSSYLNSDRIQILSKTYHLLAYVHTWPAFSNHTPGDGGSNSNSLEAIHDNIHVNVGGGPPFYGDMSDTSVAGEYTHAQ